MCEPESVFGRRTLGFYVPSTWSNGKQWELMDSLYPTAAMVPGTLKLLLALKRNADADKCSALMDGGCLIRRVWILRAIYHKHITVLSFCKQPNLLSVIFICSLPSKERNISLPNPSSWQQKKLLRSTASMQHMPNVLYYYYYMTEWCI